MKTGAAALEQIHGKMCVSFAVLCVCFQRDTDFNWCYRSVEQVDATMDAIKEQMAVASEISDAISGPITQTTIDEDELQNEFMELEQDVLNERLEGAGRAPVHTPAMPAKERTGTSTPTYQLSFVFAEALTPPTQQGSQHGRPRKKKTKKRSFELYKRSCRCNDRTYHAIPYSLTYLPLDRCTLLYARYYTIMALTIHSFYTLSQRRKDMLLCIAEIRHRLMYLVKYPKSLPPSLFSEELCRSDEDRSHRTCCGLMPPGCGP